MPHLDKDEGVPNECPDHGQESYSEHAGDTGLGVLGQFDELLHVRLQREGEHQLRTPSFHLFTTFEVVEAGRHCDEHRQHDVEG